MLNLTTEEVAILNTIPAWQRFTDQLRREVESVKEQLAAGAVLTTNAQELAINYAVTVGRINVLAEILEYKGEFDD